MKRRREKRKEEKKGDIEEKKQKIELYAINEDDPASFSVTGTEIGS
jgi:hypothetical protein